MSYFCFLRVIFFLLFFACSFNQNFLIVFLPCNLLQFLFVNYAIFCVYTFFPKQLHSMPQLAFVDSPFFPNITILIANNLDFSHNKPTPGIDKLQNFLLISFLFLFFPFSFPFNHYLLCDQFVLAKYLFRNNCSCIVYQRLVIANQLFSKMMRKKIRIRE